MGCSLTVQHQAAAQTTTTVLANCCRQCRQTAASFRVPALDVTATAASETTSVTHIHITHLNFPLNMPLQTVQPILGRFIINGILSST